MKIYNIIKDREDKEVVFDYAGSITKFESIDDFYIECEEYDLLDEDARYHITKKVLYITVK